MNKIVVIDTGIDINNKLMAFKQINGVMICKDCRNKYSIVEYKEQKNCIQDNIGHGTAVCGIILSHNPNAELFMVKLFDSNALDVDEDLLCFALEYILYHVKCDIINMSLGTCLMESERLYQICRQLYERKKYIVSAYDNNGAISYPAAFDLVVGVTSDSLCLHKNDFFLIDDESLNVCAMGRTQRLIWLQDYLITGSGNSYACAHITGFLSLYEEEPRAVLACKCIGEMKYEQRKINTDYENPVSKYTKAVIFPFNKEMHSLVRFPELLDFELVDVYDLKYSANVGVYTNDILETVSDNNYLIKNIYDIDWESFDTFVLGHLDEYLQVAKIPDFREKLIYEILKHRKYLYAYDDLGEYKIPDELKYLVFYPKITKSDMPECLLGKLYRQGKPVLGIFGTSSKQGKYTLQLMIRSKLLKRGYHVGQVGTEPTALLFGMDIVFPNGFHATTDINREDTVVYLNKAMHDISMKAEIIIVGGQSGVVIRDEGNLDNYNFSQIEFLYATQPDAVVLCVNVYDDIEIISRTKQFIESAVACCKVIALAVFPYDYVTEKSSYRRLTKLSRSAYNKYRNMYTELFQIPVFLMGDDADSEALVEHVLKFFSA